MSVGLHATSAEEMAQIIKNMHTAFADYYAPKAWKADTFGLDLHEEFVKLADAGSRGDIDEFHQSLREFFDATRDYHTSIHFAYNTVASLPMSIKYIDGGFYVAHLAPNLAASSPLRLGDRITHLNDVDVKERAYQLMGKLKDPSLTDWSLAARKLTRRASAALDPIESGSVIIKAMRGNRPLVAQMVWEVSGGVNSMIKPQAARIRSFMARLPKLPAHQRAVIENAYKHIDNRSFRVKLADLSELPSESVLDPQSLGKKESFLPTLGDRVIWRAEANSPWDAYVYLNKDNKLVGFIRIASYVADDSVGNSAFYVEKFGEIIAKMNELTDVLVIDQLNNPGGSVFYLYALASMLTDQPLATPRHRFTIDSRDVWEANQFLKEADALIALVKDLPGPISEIEGYPVDLQFLLHMKSYYQFVVQQAKEGKTLTDPYFLYGVDYIQPSSKYRYTKPILLLTNELDFSGGDFFPAIMQDNARATILGTKTSGAGGYVLANTDRNRSGIISYSYTGSIALRLSGRPLENLGVSPDIEYQISPTDLTTGYSIFKEAINQVASKMLK